MGMRDGVGNLNDKVALQRRVKHGLIPLENSTLLAARKCRDCTAKTVTKVLWARAFLGDLALHGNPAHSKTGPAESFR